MMTLAALAMSASLMSGQACAAIDNSTNTAAWTTTGRVAVTTPYTDMDVIRYEHRTPRGRTLRALIHAQDSLGVGAPGRKVRLACSD